MYAALRATSETIRRFLDANLVGILNPGMLMSLRTPEEMLEVPEQGVSLWLYRIVRDDQRLNDPPQRIAPTLLRPPPLPLRLHYLITPITAKRTGDPATEQLILGKILQILNSHSTLRGATLQAEFAGTDIELSLRLEPMALEEIARVWDALEGSYQLSVSYEVTLVDIDTAREPDAITPVDVALPEYGVITSSP